MSTYVLFHYINIEWTTNNTSIGFNLQEIQPGRRRRSVSELTPVPIRYIDGINSQLELTSNTEFPGTYAFRVDMPEVALPLPGM